MIDICHVGTCVVSACGVIMCVSSLEWDLPEVRHHLIIIMCPVMNAVLVCGVLSRCSPGELMIESVGDLQPTLSTLGSLLHTTLFINHNAPFVSANPLEAARTVYLSGRIPAQQA